MHQDMTKEGAEQILGVPAKYDREALKKAYTNLARTYHPDMAAKRGISPAQAQAKMVQVNKAYQFLRGQFEGSNANRVVVRGTWETAAAASGIESGFAGVDWRKSYGTHNYGTYANSSSWNSDVTANDDHFWDFADEGAQAADQKVPITPRTILLGPVVFRVLFVALFAYVWWRQFPLVNDNMARYAVQLDPNAPDLLGIAHLLAGLIYPTYLLVYEIFAGYLSNLVREVLNAGLSWLVRRYYDLRPKSASYGCTLSKLLKNQLWTLLLVPIVVWLAGQCLAASGPAQIVLGVLAVALGVDALAAVVHGGFVNVWTGAVAERVEDAYLIVRQHLLERCNQWNSR